MWQLHLFLAQRVQEYRQGLNLSWDPLVFDLNRSNDCHESCRGKTSFGMLLGLSPDMAGLIDDSGESSCGCSGETGIGLAKILVQETLD